MSDTPRPSSLQQWYESSHLYGGNAPYIEAWYEAWLENPSSVPRQWAEAFERLPGELNGERGHSEVIAYFRDFEPGPGYSGDALTEHKQAGVLKLVNAYRVRGHENAKLDPLGLSERLPVPDLALAFHDLDESDLDHEFDTGSLAAPERMKLRDIVALCERVYCGSIGVEYMHIVDTEKRRWLQQRLEGSGGETQPDSAVQERILESLTAAEGLEKYLHSRYVGQKRFSLEGGDSLIPLLHETMLHAGANGVAEVVMGMAHRGRLNVLVNILGKSPSLLFDEFEGRAADGRKWGDVKYHLGYSSDMETPGGNLHMALAFNPSHLEIVDPVVAGSARARQVRRGDIEHEQVMPILIHGDAAFAGQGVVMELFQMSEARGFAVGGTLHVVVNNQIGFTISRPDDARSTPYCTAIAKMVHAPIFHVNADDPEAVHHVMKIANDFRMRFKRDVVIDLVCYRRHGHNEADEPAATQPVMYQVIRSMPTTRQKYADALVEAGVIGADVPEQMMAEYRDRLDRGEQVADVDVDPEPNQYTADWHAYEADDFEPVDTTIDVERARALSERLTAVPDDFPLHNRVKSIIDNRRKMAAGDVPMDWGFAETLAYASLIEDGSSLRLVGQDSGRGTFFHRHAVLHHQQDASTLIPLTTLNDDVDVTIIDSLLSEEAVLGFEYGYATASPETLVIWEAQFGDFANGAQVVIDQFITSGEAKWGRHCGIVLFLPHGYEGQGPEHSSARLERFLQLSSDNNIEVCVPSTPAQMFHMLRRQMMRPVRRPLIVMTPKSLLRNKASTSALEQLAEGRFQEVIPDRVVSEEAVKRVIFCAGKVYYDLAAEREERGIEDIAIARVELLYPFPREQLEAELKRYANATDVVWCQEEPQNQGAWYQIRHHLQACVGDGHTLRYAGRESSPSPAAGFYAVHVEEQKQLVDTALTHGEGIIQ